MGGSMRINEINILNNITSKAELFVYLGEEMEELGYVKNAEDFTESLYSREEEATTGLTNGFAIPHGKSDEIDEPVIVFSRLKNGFDWPNADDSLTTNVFALAIPKGDYKLHIDLISGLANKLDDQKFVNELNQATTELEIKDVLAKYFTV